MPQDGIHQCTAEEIVVPVPQIQGRIVQVGMVIPLFSADCGADR